MIHRLFLRTVIFFVLTVLAFTLMRPITIQTGYPDVIKCMTAAAVLAWAEISIMWLRIAMAPKIDEQAVACDIHRADHPVAGALVYATNAFKWAIRLGAFIYLYAGAL